MTEKIQEKVSTQNETQLNLEENINYAEENKKLEEKLKELRGQSEEEQNLEHEKRKFENLKSRIEKFNSSEKETKEEKKKTLTADDVYTLNKAGYRSDSEEAQTIIKLSNALGIEKITDALKNETILKHLNSIKKAKDTERLMKETDGGDFVFDEEEAIIENYNRTGKVSSKKDAKILAKNNLKRLGF